MDNKGLSGTWKVVIVAAIILVLVGSYFIFSNNKNPIKNDQILAVSVQEAISLMQQGKVAGIGPGEPTSAEKASKVAYDEAYPGMPVTTYGDNLILEMKDGSWRSVNDPNGEVYNYARDNNIPMRT